MPARPHSVGATPVTRESAALLSLLRTTAHALAERWLPDEPAVKIFLFGSRATGRAHARSDIDVGIDLGHQVPAQVLSHFRDTFDGLPILQKVEVVDFFRVVPSFHDHALTDIVMLYERPAA